MCECLHIIDQTRRPHHTNKKSLDGTEEREKNEKNWENFFRLIRGKALIAQLAEHCANNARVDGSIPSEGSRRIMSGVCDPVFFAARRPNEQAGSTTRDHITKTKVR